MEQTKMVQLLKERFHIEASVFRTKDLAEFYALFEKTHPFQDGNVSKRY